MFHFYGINSGLLNVIVFIKLPGIFPKAISLFHLIKNKNKVLNRLCLLNSLDYFCADFTLTKFGNQTIFCIQAGNFSTRVTSSLSTARHKRRQSSTLLEICPCPTDHRGRFCLKLSKK